MHNPFDQLAKQIGKEALEPSGTTVTNDEIFPDAHHADLRHEPDPAHEEARGCLGLLGRLAALPCLIEVYGHAPDAEEFRACLAKHIAFWQLRVRTARKAKKAQGQTEPFVEPFLWIVAAGPPTAILRGLALAGDPTWPRGVYLRSEILRFGIVAASELPRDRSTLLVRLMAAGPGLRHAIEDLGALPADAYEWVVASPILLRLQSALAEEPTHTPEEQEFIVTTQQNIVEKVRNEGRNEGRTEGRNEGRTEGRNEGLLMHARATLRRMLSRRSLVPSGQDEARIDACTDVAVLDRWIDQATEAPSVAEALR